VSEVTYETYRNVARQWVVRMRRDGKVIDVVWLPEGVLPDAWIAADKAERQRRRVETFAERGNTTNKETA